MSKPEQSRGADRRKHHVIYKTTCLVTGRYYIGMHSTDDLGDGYIGSGKRLWQSIKKHGAEQHVCEVLEHLPSRQALRSREAELVNEELLNDMLCMNIALGGEGGWEQVNLRKTPEERRAAGLAGGFANKHLWSNETRERVRMISSKLMKALRAKQTREEELASIRHASEFARTPEANEKRSITMKAKPNSSNSQFGTKWCWVSSQTEIKKIKPELLEHYLSIGYIRGRKILTVAKAL